MVACYVESVCDIFVAGFNSPASSKLGNYTRCNFAPNTVGFTLPQCTPHQGIALSNLAILFLNGFISSLQLVEQQVQMQRQGPTSTMMNSYTK